ncbi:dermonecrotic toxin SPH-like [Haemaphysalis longicornis]
MPADAFNVLLYASSVEDRDLFRVLKGFGFGNFESPSQNEEAFAELGISGHRWQGDGFTNCFVDFLGDYKLPEIVACRDGQSTNCDYVDKAYVWTVDTPVTIEKMIRLGLDGITTNKPENVLEVITKTDVADLVRLAGPEDSPWTRIITSS